MNGSRVLLAGLIVGCITGVAAGWAPSPQEIERLIQQLGHGKFAEREGAQKALDAVGPEALPALRQAAASEDPEISRRARELIPILELRAETTEAIKPRRIQLSITDRPLPEAVQELKRATGLPLTLIADASLAGRKLTFAASDSGVWDALDRFCVAAGLSQEIAEDSVQQPRPAPAGQLRGGIELMTPQMPLKNLTIRLKDGKPDANATTYAGTLRIRALLPAVSDPTPPKGEGQLLLEVLSEPGFLWRGAPLVRVDQARDDKNQVVTALTMNDAVAQEQREVVFRGGNGRVFVQRAVVVGGGNQIQFDSLMADAGKNDWVQRLPIKLKLAEESGTTLKTLKGVLHGRVTLPSQPLLTIDDPLALAKTDSKSAKGKGVEMKLTSADKLGDGTVKISYELAGENVAAFGGVNAVVQVLPAPPNANGQVNLGLERGGDGSIQLFDGAGKPYKVVGSHAAARMNNGAVSNQFSFTFAPPDAKSEPKKLVYSGTRQAAVEVPFELKDVAFTPGK